MNIQVIDRFGKPVLSSVEPYAKVMIYDYEWRLIGEVILDEKGQSSVLLSPGIYNFEVRLYANEDRGIVAHCEGCYRTMITESKTVVFELKEYPTVLKIHVITLKGIPVKDVKVVLKFPVGYENDDAYTVLEKVTDSNGDAVFDKLLKGFWFFEKYNCINASIELSYMGETVRFFHPEFTTPIDNLTFLLDSFDKNLTISIGLFGWKEEYLSYLPTKEVSKENWSITIATWIMAICSIVVAVTVVVENIEKRRVIKRKKRKRMMGEEEKR